MTSKIDPADAFAIGVIAGLAERQIEKAFGREAIARKGHYRRTHTGEIVWVEPHQVHEHISQHGQDPEHPKDSSTSAYLGRKAMEDYCFKGHSVIHAMFRKDSGWVDFDQGISDSEAKRLTAETGREVKPYGIRHIWEKRNKEHRADPSKPDGKKTLMMLPEVIAKGSPDGRPSDNQIILVHKGVKVVLARAKRTNEEPGHAWIVSGYELDR